jgi:fido (protein-threonine AMPylation protein)
MNLNFEFSNDVWWRPSYYSYTNDELLDLINEYITKINIFIANPENKSEIYDFEDAYVSSYLRECLVGEGNISSEWTEHYIEQIVKDGYELSIANFGESKSREIKKIINMHNAIQNVFPNKVLPNLNIDDFTLELANSIHRQIGANLIKNAGSYRKKVARQYDENFRYVPVNEIEKEMDQLFEITRNHIGCIDRDLDADKIKQVIKIASQFLHRFLYIRPYSRGNGRVARILTSYLLSKISVVAVSLTKGNKREIYLECLRDVHYGRMIDEAPIALATLVLERVHHSLECFYIDLIDD